MVSNKQEIINDLLHVAEVLTQKNFLPATDGNFSTRLNNGNILLTAAGIEKRKLRPEDLLEIHLEDINPSRGSSEWKLHREIYLNRQEVNCVLHVHSPFLTVFAAAHKLPNQHILAESFMLIGELCLVPFAVPGTQDMGNAVIKASSTAAIYLLSNHGVVSVGKTVTEALHCLERAEFLAQTEIYAKSLGGAVEIPSEILKTLTH